MKKSKKSAECNECGYSMSLTNGECAVCRYLDSAKTSTKCKECSKIACDVYCQSCQDGAYHLSCYRQTGKRKLTRNEIIDFVCASCEEKERLGEFSCGHCKEKFDDDDENLTVGSDLLAEVEDYLYNAKVVSVDNGHVQVHFLGWSKSWDLTLKKDTDSLHSSVSCDCCKTWFHIKCLPSFGSQGRHSNSPYVCKSCMERVVGASTNNNEKKRKGKTKKEKNNMVIKSQLTNPVVVAGKGKRKQRSMTDEAEALPLKKKCRRKDRHQKLSISPRLKMSPPRITKRSLVKRIRQSKTETEKECKSKVDTKQVINGAEAVGAIAPFHCIDEESQEVYKKDGFEQDKNSSANFANGKSLIYQCTASYRKDKDKERKGCSVVLEKDAPLSDELTSLLFLLRNPQVKESENGWSVIKNEDQGVNNFQILQAVARCNIELEYDGMSGGNQPDLDHQGEVDLRKEIYVVICHLERMGILDPMCAKKLRTYAKSSSGSFQDLQYVYAYNKGGSHEELGMRLSELASAW